MQTIRIPNNSQINQETIQFVAGYNTYNYKRLTMDRVIVGLLKAIGDKHRIAGQVAVILSVSDFNSPQSKQTFKRSVSRWFTDIHRAYALQIKGNNVTVIELKKGQTTDRGKPVDKTETVDYEQFLATQARNNKLENDIAVQQVQHEREVKQLDDTLSHNQEEIDRLMKENDRLMKENDRLMKETAMTEKVYQKVAKAIKTKSVTRAKLIAMVG